MYKPYESEVFYNPYGMNLSEMRHSFVRKYIIKHSITKVFFYYY